MKKAFITDDLLKMRFVGNPKLSPNGRELLFETTEILEEENSYVTSIWRWNGQEVKPFTNMGGQTNKNDKHPLWAPDGRKIAFLSNRSGKTQIWILEVGEGESYMLSDLPKGVSSFAWSADSESIIALAKEDKEEKPLRPKATVRRVTKLKYKFNGTGYLDNIPSQLFKIELHDGEAVQLTHDSYNCDQPTPSPCGRYVAFSGNRSGNEQDLTSDIWLLDIKTKEVSRLTDGKGRIMDFVWTPDGNSIIYRGYAQAPYPGGYPHLWQIELKTQERALLTEKHAHFIGKVIGNDASSERGHAGISISGCGRYVYFPCTIGGNCYLYRLNRDTRQVEKVFGEGQQVVSSYDVSQGHLAVNLASPTSCGDIWYGEIDSSLAQLTNFNEELFTDKYIALPERVSFTHADGTELEGWLLKPLDFEEGKTYPLIMEIHGGPHMAYGNIFFHEFQILAGHGFGVFYSNPRGSLGYGEEFARAVVGDWCGIDANDLEFMAREISEVEWVDKTRMGVTGGSQGGYFTNWLISHTDIFSAAVTQRSMSNLYTKYGIADNGWNGDRYGMGGADLWDNEDFVLERSPIRYAPNVNTPLLIIHSDMDFRCPLEQAEQWYVALKRLGNETEMLLFHGENHGLSRVGKPANRLVRLDAILDWFERYLHKA